MKRQVPEAKENELVHFHGPKASDPVRGHAGTSYEGRDATTGLVLWSLAIIGGTLVIVFVLIIGIQKWLQTNNPPGELASPLAPSRVIAPAPQIQVHPWEDLPEMRADEDRLLNSYGKYKDGRFHIPINVAMNSVLPTLKIAPNAPQGLTTPGGEGRDFARGLNDMPPPYRRPQIQGEIQKHVK
ncbi:MAG TPA: hypothetical protein VLI55_03850 [Bryobacteraceae bacterium]|nr:hypothetical protein [Bryobacteraceae bacterium]